MLLVRGGVFGYSQVSGVVSFGLKACLFGDRTALPDGLKSSLRLRRPNLGILNLLSSVLMFGVGCTLGVLGMSSGILGCLFGIVPSVGFVH